MIAGDISEHKNVHNRFKERLGDNYCTRELGTFDCQLKKIIMTKMSKFFCGDETEVPLLIDNGFIFDMNKTKCVNCKHREYIRFADFEIVDKRAYWERKTAADFVGSRKARLYDQLNRMDMFISGRKGLILEGMPRHSKFEDSNKFFSGYDKRTHDLRGLSPLEQAIEIAGGDKERNWCLSFIREIWVWI